MSIPSINPAYKESTGPPSYEESIGLGQTAPPAIREPFVADENFIPPQPRLSMFPEEIVLERTPLIAKGEKDLLRRRRLCSFSWLTCCLGVTAIPPALVCILVFIFFVILFIAALFLLLLAMALYFSIYDESLLCPAIYDFYARSKENDGSCCTQYSETCCSLATCKLLSDYSSVLNGEDCVSFLQDELACAPCNKHVYDYGYDIIIGANRTSSFSCCESYCHDIYDRCSSAIIIDSSSPFYGFTVGEAYSSIYKNSFCTDFLEVSLSYDDCYDGDGYISDDN